MSLLARIKNRILCWSLPVPFHARHVEYSMLASLDDDTSRPTQRLLQLSLEALRVACQVDLSWISQRMASPPYYPEIWPGEHYKLLAGFVAAHRPKCVLEV